MTIKYKNSSFNHENLIESETRSDISVVISVKLLKTNKGSTKIFKHLIIKTPKKEVNNICIYAFRLSKASGRFNKYDGFAYLVFMPKLFTT